MIGSDILYERSHPRDLAHALTALAGKRARIAVADPLRPYLQEFMDEMGRLGYRADEIPRTVRLPGQPDKDVLVLLFGRKQA